MRQRSEPTRASIHAAPVPLGPKRPPLDEALDRLTKAHEKAVYGPQNSETTEIAQLILEAKALIREGKH